MKRNIGNSLFISVIVTMFGLSMGVLIGLTFDVPLPEQLIITNPPPQEWIFQNNSSVAIGLSLGGLLFGFITIGILLFNSVFLGYWFQERIRSQGLMMVFILVVPHGIFEIPALLLAGSVGIEITKWTFRLFFSSPSYDEEIKDQEGRSNDGFIKWVMTRMIVVEVLLYIASFIESYLTPLLVDM
ncbi:MAG: hypothetical protein GF411_20060 [Candidatus Lokiarchaeota archaeon]|nr:hypothetical protein [Candidatus Lokiarchaeota archaeon]